MLWIAMLLSLSTISIWDYAKRGTFLSIDPAEYSLPELPLISPFETKCEIFLSHALHL